MHSNLRAIGGDSTFCEFKGSATYFDIFENVASVAPNSQPDIQQGAWTYNSTSGANKPIEGYICFYARNGITVLFFEYLSYVLVNAV
eukprot:m.60665 g.60665  ORF g.60665 m.60665 type:complete len:87 (-) comp11342_c0_seq1:28-288(-)